MDERTDGESVGGAVGRAGNTIGTVNQATMPKPRIGNPEPKLGGLKLRLRDSKPWLRHHRLRLGDPTPWLGAPKPML